MNDDMRRYVRRGCTDRATRDVLLAALDQGARMKATKAGVMVHGPNGSTSAHFSVSDKRAALNLRAQLRRSGVPV
jgi:hypothetical protein